jgi:AAA15 family ATPase/GTPase
MVNSEAGLEMYLKELSINNFKSFYGTHTFCLEKGINVIQSDSGIGKTNLCKAIEFALLGTINMNEPEATNIINNRRIEEADSKLEYIGCQVRLHIEDNHSKLHRIERMFSIPWKNNISEDLHYSDQFPKITRSEYNRHIYVDDISQLTEDSQDRSIEQRMLKGLHHLTSKKNGTFKDILLLDDVLDRFSSKNYEHALSILSDSELEQILLFVGNTQKIPTSIVSNYIQLGKTVETVTFKVHNFPFQPKSLINDIDIMIYDRYVSEGEVFKREVYGQEYTVEAEKVVPNGAIYRRNLSKLEIT